MSLLAALTIAGPITVAGLLFIAGQRRFGWRG